MPEPKPIPVKLVNRRGDVGEFTVSPEMAALLNEGHIDGVSIAAPTDHRHAAVSRDLEELAAARRMRGIEWP